MIFLLKLASKSSRLFTFIDFGYTVTPINSNCCLKVDKKLLIAIKTEHEQSRGTYGSPRICAALRQRGISCGRHRIARLMRENGLRGCRKRRKRPITTRRGMGAIAANGLAQNFSASRPNEKWVTDITYIDTQEGWLYLAIVLDLFSRKVVGWSMSEHLHAKLVADESTTGDNPHGGTVVCSLVVW